MQPIGISAKHVNSLHVSLQVPTYDLYVFLKLFLPGLGVGVVVTKVCPLCPIGASIVVVGVDVVAR